MSTWSSFPWLSRITPPTLIFAGDDDPLMPLSSPMMIALRMPCARVLVVPDEGHFLLLDRDGQAPPQINEFLAAERLDTSEVWASALCSERSQPDDQPRPDGLGALPWGPVSALVREAVGRYLAHADGAPSD